MRMVITSPPKMGNKWLKCLLGTIYGLDWVLGDDKPETNPAKFRQWVAEGNFADNTIFHQHCRYTSKLCDVVDAIPAHIVTIVRDPYDSFVSMYYWIQTRSAYDEGRGKVRPNHRPKDNMIGKAIDDPEILEFLTTSYGENLRRANDWVHSGRAAVARYEALHADPVGELTKLTNAIAPVDPVLIETAIEACTADKMRSMSKKMATHIRSAKVGDSKERLSQPHYDIFRSHYADLVRSLNYEVR